MKKLLLTDVLNIAFRWYFVLRKNPLKVGNLDTSAIHGTLFTAISLMKEHKCEYLAMCGDCLDTTFRKQACSEYKAGRSPMPEDMKESLKHLDQVCQALNMPVLRVNGAEADDIIGSLATSANEQGFITLIATSDKDLCQLCNERTWVLRPRTGGGFSQVGVQEICTEWQIHDPKQLIDILALAGDSSDNFKGVPGIGNKTASKLIAAYDTAQAVYHNRYDLTDKLCAKIEAHKSDIALCKWLATIQCDLQEFLPTVESLLWQPPNDLAILDRYHLNKVKELILGKQTTGMYRS